MFNLKWGPTKGKNDAQRVCYYIITQKLKTFGAEQIHGMIMS